MEERNMKRWWMVASLTLAWNAAHAVWMQQSGTGNNHNMVVGPLMMGER